MQPYLIFLVIALFIAATLARDDFAFTLLYFLGGIFLLGRWWASMAANKLGFSRKFTPYAFPKQEVDVTLTVTNNSHLPIPWLQVIDGLSLDLRDQRSYQEVVSLWGKSSTTFNYTLKPRKRGYYDIGPLRANTGDIIGMMNETQIEGESDHIIIYPEVIHLPNLHLPSLSPQGTLKTHHPLFEDPTRPTGKRDYIPGDSLRRIDWKATAANGKMQVRLFEPSISLETAIFLNLNREDYELRTRVLSTEFAIVIAASIANRVNILSQAVGIWVHGKDPLSEDKEPHPLPPRKGRSELIRLLALLARIETRSEGSFSDLIAREIVDLPWGTTLAVITGEVNEDLFDQLYRAKRQGLNVVLIIVGVEPDFKVILEKARLLGIHAFHFEHEKDLNIWRG